MQIKIKRITKEPLSSKYLEWIVVLIALATSIKFNNSSLALIMLLFLIVLTYSLECIAIFIVSTMVILDSLRFAASFNTNLNIEAIGKTMIFVILFTIVKYTLPEKDYFISKTIKQYWVLLAPIVIIGVAPIILGPSRILEQLFRGYDNVGHLAIMNSLTNCQEFLTQCLNAKTALPITYNQYPQQWHILFAQDASSSIPILYWYWIAITSTLLLALIILIKSINYTGRKILDQPISVFRLAAASSLIIAMWSAGYINYVFSIVLLIMGFTLCRNLQLHGLILGSTVLGLAMASYTLFIPAIGIWLILQLFQYSLLGKKESIFLMIYLCLFSFYAVFTLLNSLQNGQLDALNEISNSWKITIPLMITISTVMLKTISKIQIAKNLEVYAFLFSCFLIQMYLFYKNQIGGYFLYKNVVALLVLFLLSNTELKIFIKPAKIAFSSFLKNVAKHFGYKISISGYVKNYEEVSKTAVTYAILIISFIWTIMPSNALPSPLQDFTSRIKSVALGDSNRSDEILEIVEQTARFEKPVLYLSPDYYFYTQWIAALNGNWPTTLQQNIDQIVREKGISATPNLLDTNQGILHWKPIELDND